MELYDKAQETLGQRKKVLLASQDKAAAFGAALQKYFLDSRSAKGVNGYLYRYVHGWLPRRGYTLRLALPQGQEYSRHSDITRALPQAGVLSPFPRLLHFDQLQTALVE